MHGKNVKKYICQEIPKKNSLKKFGNTFQILISSKKIKVFKNKLLATQ